MYKELQTISLIKTELIDIQAGLTQGITRTNNSKIRIGYLKIYNKIKGLIDELNRSQESSTNELFVNLKHQTLSIDPNAEGFSLHYYFSKDSETSNFVQFKMYSNYEN